MSAVLTERRTYRDYSSDFKAEVLAALQANSGNVLRTANQYQIDESVLRRWVVNQDVYRSLSEQKSLDLAAKSESNAHLLADSIACHDLETASLAQKATAFGIMVDKMQLLRGQPTSITETVERQDLTVILQSALSSALSGVVELDASNNTPIE